MVFRLMFAFPGLLLLGASVISFPVLLIFSIGMGMGNFFFHILKVIFFMPGMVLGMTLGSLLGEDAARMFTSGQYYPYLDSALWAYILISVFIFVRTVNKI